MAVNINIPSQVKTYANLAAFPASGSLKTIYIAEDTNKTYRWTGIVYVEISASAAMTWGQIGGTLSNQTDLQNALDAKVPTTRTLTINGTTQDLSANRTFNIPTDLTVGTTPISSGTIGRVLFEGTGNVLQESANLFWDNTNVRIGIGTSTPAQKIDVLGNVNGGNLVNIKNASTGAAAVSGFQCENSISNGSLFLTSNNYTPNGVLQANTLGFFSNANMPIAICSGNHIVMSTGGTTERMRVVSGTGNVLINTTTDAGFRLDVNGTARVSGNFNIATGFELNFNNQNVGLYRSSNNLRLGGFGGIEFLSSATTIASQTIRMTLFSTGNFAINTTTDAGFRLDVNGTARVSGVFSVGSDTARIDLWRSSGAFGGRIGTGYSNPAVNHVYIQCDTNSKAILIDDSNRTLFSSSNGDTTTASAQVTINSSTRGFLPPRMTTTQRNAIASPAAGLVVYDNTDNKHYGYNGTTWNAFY
jgi:hypothetical protein